MATQFTHPNASHEKARRRFWLGSLIAAFCLIILPLSMYALWSYRYSRRISKKLEAIAARGEPVVASQLNSMYLLTPEQEDVTELWRQSFKATFEPDGQQWSQLLARHYATKDRRTVLDHFPQQGESWPDFTLAETYLKEFRQVHDQFHEAAKRGGHARWKVDYNDGERLLTAVDQSRRCAWLLQLEFYVNAKNGDASSCAKCLKTMLALRNALIHEPCFWTQLTANRIDQETLEVLSQSLCQLPFNESDLIDLQKAIRSRSIVENFKLGLTSNRAEGYSAMASYRSMGEESPWIPATNFDLDFYLEAMNEYVEALEAQPETALQKFEAIDARVSAKADKSKTQFSLAYSSLMFQRPKALVLEIALSAQAKQLAADAAIAIELYRRENGKLPATLDALVPKHLPSLPTDPFSGKPMHYKLEEKGFTIYSVGKNKTDEGGNLDPKTGDEGLYFPRKTP